MGYGMEKWETHVLVEALRELAVGDELSDEDINDAMDGINDILEADNGPNDARIAKVSDFLQGMKRG